MRNRERNRTRRRKNGEVIARNPGSRRPFARITKLVQAANAAMGALRDFIPGAVGAAVEKARAAYENAQAALAAYTSRGHGHKPTMQRRIGGAWSLDRSKYSDRAYEDRKHAHG